jgi:hypothetical protein
MQICFAPYPQTIEQMGEWAEKVTQLDQQECAVALNRLDAPRAIRLRKVK